MASPSISPHYSLKSHILWYSQNFTVQKGQLVCVPVQGLMTAPTHRASPNCRTVGFGGWVTLPTAYSEKCKNLYCQISTLLAVWTKTVMQLMCSLINFYLILLPWQKVSLRLLITSVIFTLDVSGVIQLITSPLIFLKSALLCSISQTKHSRQTEISSKSVPSSVSGSRSLYAKILKFMIINLTH